MDSPLVPIPPNIASLTTPLLFGEIFSAYMFGVLSVQVYMYYLNFPKDVAYIKALVYCVFAIEFASSIMCLSDSYRWFAKGFGSVLALDDIYLSAFDTPMMGAFIASAVQMFYCYRIYVINKKAWKISVLVSLLALAQCSAGIFSAVVAAKAKTFSKATSKAKTGAYVLFICAAAADIIIAVTMITLLLLSRERVRSAPQQRTENAIRRIINLIVETNLASASLALLTVILLVVLPNTNYFTCPSLFLGRIYSNSLLLIFNNRHHLKQGHETPGYPSRSLEMSRLPVNNNNNDFSSSQSRTRNNIHIGVDTAITTYPDFGDKGRGEIVLEGKGHHI